MKGHHLHGVGVAALGRRLGGHPESERQVGHGVQDHALQSDNNIIFIPKIIREAEMLQHSAKNIKLEGCCQSAFRCTMHVSVEEPVLSWPAQAF